MYYILVAIAVVVPTIVALWFGFVAVTGFIEGYKEGYRRGRPRREWFRVYCEDEDETEESWRNLWHFWKSENNQDSQ